MRKRAVAAAFGCTALLLLTGCTSQAASGESSRFVMAIDADPGTLDPALTVASTANQLNRFLYDSLTKPGADGTDVPNLASEWTATTTEATFTLRKGITCSDGTELTATTVADNFTFIADPANASPLLGFLVQPGTTAVPDDAAGTVTVTSGAPDAFLVKNLSSVNIVCAAGLADRDTLADGASGTGMYTLTKAVANDHYLLTRRDGYDWAPGDQSAVAKSAPDTVDLRVIQGAGTAANLLLSGEINAAKGSGTDTARLKAAGLSETTYPSPVGQLFFNEAAGRVGDDEAVRDALVQGLDLADLRKVMTGGTGEMPSGLVPVDPAVCTGSPTDDAFPKFDTKAAAAALDAAGWTVGADGVRSKDGKPLALEVLYAAGSGAEFDASMEFVQEAWTGLGVKVHLVAAGDAQIGQVLDETGEWDASFVTLGFTLPSQAVPFVSGAGPTDGLNSGHIDNSDYTEHATTASGLAGTDGCEEWNAAEHALFTRSDVVPFANQLQPWFAKGATFDLYAGQIVPSSIRLQG